jgi:hypothetical protein
LSPSPAENAAPTDTATTAPPVRVLMISEMNAPNISVYPDTNQVGIFDASIGTVKSRAGIGVRGKPRRIDALIAAGCTRYEWKP